MRVTWLGHRIYLGVSLVIFLWTLSYQGVSISDFMGPFQEYAVVVFGMIIFATIPLVLMMAVRALTDREKRKFLPTLFAWTTLRQGARYLMHLAPPIVAFIVTMGSFAVHKARVLPTLGYDWDAQFIVWDRWLFGGHDPWQITHELFSSPHATWLIDQVYHSWFYPMFIAYGFCVLMIQAPMVRICYIGTYLVSWLVIGTVLAGLFASAGPAYDGLLFNSGDTYSALMARLADQALAVGGLDALNYQRILYDGYQEGTAAVGYGISAMPSMHIALAVMWMLLFFNLNRWLGVIGVFYVVLVWIGSVHLGWHYAVDGVMSGVVVLVIWFSLRTFLTFVSQLHASVTHGSAETALPAEAG